MNHREPMTEICADGGMTLREELERKKKMWQRHIEEARAVCRREMDAIKSYEATVADVDKQLAALDEPKRVVMYVADYDDAAGVNSQRRELTLDAALVKRVAKAIDAAYSDDYSNHHACAAIEELFGVEI